MARTHLSSELSATPTVATCAHWWLAVLGRQAFWAYLREKEAGTAEIVDHNGQHLLYDSVDSARAALLEADYRAFDGLDAADALTWGISIADFSPPRWTSTEPPLNAMQVQLGRDV